MCRKPMIVHARWLHQRILADLGKQQAGALKLGLVELERRYSAHAEHEAHGGEKQNLHNQAPGRTIAPLNVPYENAQDPED